MLDELLKEIDELKEYKKQYEHQKKDKAVMSEKLLEYATKEYKKKSYKTRVEEQIKGQCSGCRFNHSFLSDHCGLQDTFPKNIGEPIASDKDWIPGRVCCEEFEWD